MNLVCPQRVGVMIAAALVSFAAHAAPGEHLTVGDTVITPGVAAGVEYSNNALHVAEVGPTSSAVDLTVAPRIDFKLTRENVDFDLGGSYQLRKYFGAAARLDRYDDFGAHATLDALKHSVVGVKLEEDAGLQNFPMEDDTSVHPYTSETSSQTTAGLALRPGYSLEINAAGEFDINDYAIADSSSSSGNSHFNTRYTYGPTAGVAWKFLPRTAVVLDFSYLHSTYEKPAVGFFGFEDTTFEAHNVTRIDGGLRGRITNRTVVTLTAGYGAGAYGDTSGSVDKSDNLGGNPDGGKATVGESLQHLLADASLQYNLTETTSLTVGVDKDFRDSFFTNYVSYVKGYVSADARFGGHFGVVGGFDATSEAFRGSENRNDLLLAARGDLNYYIRDWVWVNAGGGWTERASDNAEVQYDEFTGHLKINVTY